MNIKESYDMLVEQLKTLVNVGKELLQHDSLTEIDRSEKGKGVHPWTILKLIFLQLYTRFYTSIIPRYYRNMVYLDLFAGKGINIFERYDTPIPGSPIVAWYSAESSFNKLYLVEKNKEYAELLERRIDLVAPKNSYYVYKGEDCNEAIYEIMEELEKRLGTHYLAFIDPYGLNVKWETMERMLNSQVGGDAIVLVQTFTLGRQAGKFLKGTTRNPATLNNFFGDEQWQEWLEGEVKKKEDKRRSYGEILLEYYMSKINSLEKRKDAPIIPVSVKLYAENVHYTLLFITRKTRGGNPWLEGVYRMKDFVESASKEHVYKAIDYALGKQNRLLKYL